MVAQLPRQLRLGDGVAAGRATAEVPVRHRRQVEAQAGEHAFHGTAELLRVLQGAGAMEGQAQVATAAEAVQRRIAQHLHQVPGQLADPHGLGGVARIVLEQMAVILDEGAAATGCLHYGFGAGLDGRPPGVDIAPGAVEAGVLGIQVVVHGAAATRFTGWLDADAQAVQHTRSGGIGVGRKPRLYAAFEHQHTAGVADGRAWTRRTNLARQLGLERFRQQRAEGIAGACQRLEKSSMGHHGAQPGTQHALAKGARYMVLDHRAADVQQVVVLHA
ncbi:hypothetical protein D3C84_738140 [compost metagenome]